MKCLLLALAIPVFWSCSRATGKTAVNSAQTENTPEQRAAKLIKAEMFRTLEDYDSYEPVEFGKLDTLTYFRLTMEYAAILDVSYDVLMSVNRENYNEYMKLHDELTEQATLYTHNQNELKAKIPGSDTDYVYHPFLKCKMFHSFRSKNGMGAFKLSHVEYYFDSAVTKIVDQYDITNIYPALKGDSSWAASH